MLQVKCLTSIAELTAISQEWDQLLANSPNDSYSLSWSWISAWMTVFLEQQNPLCLAVYDNGKLVGLAPFWVATVKRFPVGQVKVLRFLGSEEVSGDHLDIVVARKNSKAVLTAIWEHLFGVLRNCWDIWEYHYVPVGSNNLQAMLEWTRRDARCLSFAIDGLTVCPYISLPGSWDEYLASISRSSRGNLKSSTELLNQAGQITLRECNSTDSLPEFLNTHIALHRKSWQDRGESGSFATDQFRRFHFAFAQELLRTGRLLLLTMELNGQPIASLYAFEYNKTMHYYLMGVDRSAVPKAGIGRVVLGHAVKASIERGCQVFDMLRGFEEYKYYWTDRERHEVVVTLHNRTWKSIAFLVAQSLARLARQLVKFARALKAAAPRAEKKQPNDEEPKLQ